MSRPSRVFLRTLAAPGARSDGGTPPITTGTSGHDPSTSTGEPDGDADDSVINRVKFGAL